jgi:23S rRNA (guanosine2251-2'-O)-methyltransferase
MSPRFERRPEKRTGGGARGAGRPPRFSGPNPEWRREGAGEGREGPKDRDGRREPGAASTPRGVSRFQPRRDGSSDRPSSRGERRPFERRGDSDRPYGDRRPERFSADRPSFDRPTASRFSSDRPGLDSKPYDRRPAGRFDGRPQGRRPDSGRPDGRRFEGGGRSEGRRFDGGGRPTPGRFAAKPLIVDADSLPPSGDAERHSVDPSTDLIWGRHPAQAALESGRPIHRVWCTPEMRFSPKFLQLLREAKSSGVLVEEVTWARLGQLTGGAVHQGITLQTAAAETLDLPTLMEGCATIGEPALLMAVDGLTDPQNLGAIVRSAEALGAHGLVLPQRRSAGLTGSVAKVAAGALEHLPVARVVNLNRALDTLKQEGYRVVGLAAEGTVSLEEADLEGPLVIVTGSEGDGLSMLTRRNCDQLVRIPLRGATPSLNASVATALLLYEVARRGWMKGLSGSQPAPRLVRPQLPAPAARPEVAEAPLDVEESYASAENISPNQSENSLEPLHEQELALEPEDLEEEPAQEQQEVVAEEQSAAAIAPEQETVLELGFDQSSKSGFFGDIQL